jgi:hypothetical protein
VFSEIAPTSFRFEQAFSTDGGKSWEVIGKQRSPGPDHMVVRDAHISDQAGVARGISKALRIQINAAHREIGMKTLGPFLSIDESGHVLLLCAGFQTSLAGSDRGKILTRESMEDRAGARPVADVGKVTTLSSSRRLKASFTFEEGRNEQRRSILEPGSILGHPRSTYQ